MTLWGFGEAQHFNVNFNVTEHPTVEWTAQQIIEAFPTTPLVGDAFSRLCFALTDCR
jgi:hypothetical protein